MTGRLPAAVAKLRRVGVRRSLRRGPQIVARRLRGHLLTPVRRRRPRRVTPADLRASLGPRGAIAALRGPVLAAMPTVGAFEHSLTGMSAPARADLLARAERVRNHTFDLLGSGPTQLGRQIDWLTDFKTGRRWPMRHHSIVPIAFGDGSDIKVPWELSRAQHLPLLAAAHRLTGDQRHLDEIGAQLRSWQAQNPPEIGPNWVCTMDVAIRAANWIATLAMCAQGAHRERWFEDAIGALLQHGRFVVTHLEDGPVRGNHYLSNVVGLLPIAALFHAGKEGQAWSRFASEQLVAEMEHQVHTDGCAHEASIPYHRLVCELFVCGTQAVDALRPGILPDSYRERLGRMVRFVADYTRPDGLAPIVGDADDGRFLPLGDYGTADARSHHHLFRQAGVPVRPATACAAYPEGGYFILRSQGLYALIRCGPTGLAGLGPHAHNDQLSFELAYGETPLVIDPGSYVYTADPAWRNRFRSTAFHSTLRIGGAEQNRLRHDVLFGLPDETRAECRSWEPDGRSPAFAGLHRGFAALDPPVQHERRVELHAGSRSVVVTDVVSGRGEHELQWTFPLAPSRVSVGDGWARAEFEGIALSIGCEGLTFSVDEGWYSPSYGIRKPTPFLRARRRGRPGRDRARFVLQVEPC